MKEIGDDDDDNIIHTNIFIKLNFVCKSYLKLPKITFDCNIKYWL